MSNNKFELAGFRSGTPANIHYIRDFTDDEISKYHEFIGIYANARRRFRLFRILQRNHGEWHKFLLSCKSSTFSPTDEMIELDRLMLNYLTSAKALLDHFKQFYVQTFRNTVQENDFNDVIHRLAASCWSFAFFQDFRNFVQHCGLPIGSYNKRDVNGSFEIRVEVKADCLLKDYNNWKVSQLKSDHGNLNLIALSNEYYLCLIKDIGVFLAERFFPQLIEAHNFFASLGNEVATKVPDHRIIIITSRDLVHEDLDLRFDEPPSDVLGELGFKVAVFKKPDS